MCLCSLAHSLGCKECHLQDRRPWRPSIARIGHEPNAWTKHADTIWYKTYQRHPPDTHQSSPSKHFNQMQICTQEAHTVYVISILAGFMHKGVSCSLMLRYFTCAVCIGRIGWTQQCWPSKRRSPWDDSVESVDKDWGAEVVVGGVDLGCRICVKSLKIEGMRGRRLGKEEHFWDDDRCVEINTNDLVWCHVSSYAAEYNLFWCASVILSLESLPSKKWYQMVDQFYCTSPILPAHLSGAYEGFGIAISRWQDGQQNGGNA